MSAPRAPNPVTVTRGGPNQPKATGFTPNKNSLQGRSIAHGGGRPKRDASKPSTAPDPVRAHRSGLTFEGPARANRTVKAPTQKKEVSPSKARSVDKPRERDVLHCKARPKDNKPRGGGGGSKRFVPWCS